MADFPSTLPTADTLPLRGGPVLRWGIVAPGDIAKDFVHAIHTHTDQRAVSEHRRLALLAIAAGKHVLVEKPIAVTAAEAREIQTAARAAGVFAMEGMWTRYLPQTDVILRLMDDGVLGDIRLVLADFATRAPVDPANRNYNPDLAGGSLLDLGIYPVWISQLALGAPERVNTFGSLTDTGVDAQTAAVLEFTSGAQSVLTTSLLHFSPARASINGTQARIEINPWFVVPAGFDLVAPGKGDKRLSYVNDSGLEFRDGIAWEAAAVAFHVAEGRTDSPLHPLDFAIDVLTTMDSIRRSAGTLVP
jgi:predicted dehydrogenase